MYLANYGNMFLNYMIIICKTFSIIYAKNSQMLKKNNMFSQII
jgi:hypothetical protein